MTPDFAIPNDQDAVQTEEGIEKSAIRDNWTTPGDFSNWILQHATISPKANISGLPLLPPSEASM